MRYKHHNWHYQTELSSLGTITIPIYLHRQENIWGILQRSNIFRTGGFWKFFYIYFYFYNFAFFFFFLSFLYVSKNAFRRFYVNPAPVIRSMQSRPLTTACCGKPGTGADDAFVLKRCVTLPTGNSRCTSDSNLSPHPHPRLHYILTTCIKPRVI